ncbi:MAG: hypothetical protein O2960_30790 [Verrucomicrobia bacterium]|nr:hypothetical protein [Verrucomicrobiota bacterium]
MVAIRTRGIKKNVPPNDGRKGILAWGALRGRPGREFPNPTHGNGRREWDFARAQTEPSCGGLLGFIPGEAAIPSQPP